jgi:hypothetical protein
MTMPAEITDFARQDGRQSGDAAMLARWGVWAAIMLVPWGVLGVLLRILLT